jgi:hypothetical protein
MTRSDGFRQVGEAVALATAGLRAFTTGLLALLDVVHELGMTWKRSPTTPKSASSKIGASARNRLIGV